MRGKRFRVFVAGMVPVTVTFLMVLARTRFGQALFASVDDFSPLPQEPHVQYLMRKHPDNFVTFMADLGAGRSFADAFVVFGRRVQELWAAVKTSIDAPGPSV